VVAALCFFPATPGPARRRKPERWALAHVPRDTFCGNHRNNSGDRYYMLVLLHLYPSARAAVSALRLWAAVVYVLSHNPAATNRSAGRMGGAGAALDSTLDSRACGTKPALRFTAAVAITARW